MNTNSFYKGLMPVAVSTTPDNGKGNHSSAYHRNLGNTSNPVDRQNSSHSSIPNISSRSSGRGVIDARTYVDAQSNGLTQRIVRYDEENKKTPSVYNRAYKRAGDFPIVHLDKPKLVLTPKRNIANPPKIARIGQPDPCTNRTHIRAEILRNGTMMPTVSLDRREDVDNVRVDPLDALKEISRKRIHCEDTINPIQPTVEKDSTDSISNQSPTRNNSKRQRIASGYSSSSNETSKRGGSNSKCNEILSSLSSSSYMLSDSAKRAKLPSPPNSISPPQAKRLQTEKPIEAPVIDTEAVISVTKPVEKIIPPEVAEKTYPTELARPKLTLFNRPYSANPSTVQRANAGRNDECNISFVKPRPMTARSRESVENWFKVKPEEKRRLSLMLKCLSGEVDDDSDTVDGGEKAKQIPKPDNPIAEDSSTKPLGQDNSAAETSVVAAVAPPTQVGVISKTSTLLPTTPAVSFNPVSTTAPLLPLTTTVQPSPTAVQQSATIVQPPAPIAQAAATVEERKGGFSFPLATKESTTTTSAPTAVVSLTPPMISPSSNAPATPLVVASSKDPLPTLTPSVSFTFQPSKPKVTFASSVAATVEPTKTFTFGTASNATNDTKSTPVFGMPAPPAETTKLTTSSKLEEPKQTGSFAAFGQTTSTAGNINFGQNSLASTAAPTFAFGSVASSNAFNKGQPPAFGTTQTASQQSVNSDKTIQSNKNLTFSTNEQTSAFGNTMTMATATAQKQVDPRMSNIATTLAANQAINSTSSIGSSSFVFGATTNSQATTKPALPSVSSFSGTPINSTPSIFGSTAPQQQQQSSTSTSVFGAPATTTTSLFGQTPKVDSIKSSQPEKSLAPNMFGSSSASKPSPNFTFSANQANANNNIFGSQALANSGAGNSFNFGGSIQKSDVSSGAGKSFSFSGNNIETKPVVFGASKSVAPTFGTVNVSDSTKSIGFPATNPTSATNLFTNTSANEMPKVFSFGASNNPSSTNAVGSFGGTGSTFGTSTAFGAAAPTFGSTKATPSFTTNATPAFGSSSSTSTFGSANATPSFGSANPNPSFATANTTFGSANATPSFGSANATPSFGSANSNPSFASGNAAPSFGNANATQSFTSANATSPFGSTPSFATANATPSFGTSNATPSFGGANAALAFGGSNATPSFGGTGFAANSGPPSFGSNSNGSSNSVFGGSGSPAFSTSTGTADANRTFNFTGSDPAPSPVPNLFNIGPGNPAPRGRTIRTATRRAYR